MDTDSLPPLLTLLGFLALFAYLSLAENAGGNGNGLLRDSAPAQQRPWFVLAPLKYACVIAAAISAFFLARALSPNSGFATAGYLALMSLALLVALTVIHRLAGRLAQQRPALADACSRPALALLRRARTQRPAANPSNGNGHAPDDNAVPPPPEITQAELDTLDHRDWAMLQSIIKLDEATAHQIMIPRLDMVALEINTPLPEAVKPIIETGYYRIPVYEDNLDHIVGIIHSIELLKHLSRDDWKRLTLHDIEQHRPYFVPETKRLDSLLEEIQKEAVQMAIVVDEYGSAEGLITMEDLLEQIVGEIEDEFSKDAAPEIDPQPDGSVAVTAGVTIDQIRSLFGVELSAQDANTIGGYVYTTLGRMPQEGDTVTADRLSITVTSIDGRRIRRLHIQPRAADDADTPAETNGKKETGAASETPD